jgi:hypothetical protein
MIAFNEYGANFIKSGIKKNIIYIKTSMLLEHLKLTLYSLVLPELKMKIHQVRVMHRNNIAIDFSFIINKHHELYYQILFYQEPSKSKLLYNRSGYTFPPAINGDFKENSHELYSFFSRDLQESFWVGYDSDLPGYVQLPKGIIGLIESEYFEIYVFIDFYILTENQVYASEVADEYEYPLISVLDEAGNEIFSVKHALSKNGFDPGNSYEIELKLFMNGMYQSSNLVQINEFYKTSNTFLILQFHRAQSNSTIVEVSYCKEL